MNALKKAAFLLLAFLLTGISSCKKEHEPPLKFRDRQVSYIITGTNMRLNYIDSLSGFQRDKLYSGSFRYVFKRGPGTSIGISIFKASAADTIYSWQLYIDEDLHANGFSEGGVYMTIPYDN